MIVIYARGLTHDGELVQRPVLLPGLCPRDKVSQADGAQRDEAEVDAVQERPGSLQLAEHGGRRHKEAQHYQDQQQREVEHGGRPRPQTQALQEADGAEDQRLHEPLDAGGEHQHGEGDSYQGIEDGEGLPSVGQRSGVAVTWGGWKEKDVGRKSGGTRQAT